MKRLLQLGILCGAMWLAGCGGGGDGGSNPPAGDPTSRVQVSVNWPERSRAVTGPSSALSFALTLQGLQTNGGRVTVQNRGAAAAHAETYNIDVTAPRQQYPFRIDFFAGENATGEVVATAGGNVTLAPQPTPIPDVALTGTIASVSVPAGHTALVGQTTAIAAEAKDGEGHTVAVSPGSFTWHITSGGDKLAMEGDGFRGTAIGAAEVTVTVDGKTSSAVPVRVGQKVVSKGKTALKYVAFQDGAGPWAQVMPMAGSTTDYEAVVFNESGKYGWIFATGNDQGYDNSEFYFVTTNEITTIQRDRTFPAEGPADEFKVKLTGQSATDTVFVGDKQIPGDRQGVNVRRPTTQSSDWFGYTLVNGVTSRMLITRDVPPTVNSITFDFQGASSFASEVTNVNAEAEVEVDIYLEKGAADATRWSIVRSGTGPGTNFFMPPSAKLRGSDRLLAHGFRLEADGTRRELFGYRPANAALPSEMLYLPRYDGLVMVRPRSTNGMTIKATLPEVSGADHYRYWNGPNDVRMSQGWHGTGALTYETPLVSSLPGAPPFAGFLDNRVFAYALVSDDTSVGQWFGEERDSLVFYNYRLTGIDKRISTSND